MFESTDELVVIAAVPGIEPEDISLRLADGVLEVETAARGEEAAAKYFCREWSYGPYLRSIAIPRPVDGARANVAYGNGVLTIALPKDTEFTNATLEVQKVGQARGVRKGKEGGPGSPV